MLLGEKDVICYKLSEMNGRLIAQDEILRKENEALKKENEELRGRLEHTNNND